MEKIIPGVAKFRSEVFPERKHLFEKLATGQEPRALFLTCADSRIDPSLLTQTDPGELFICRNAGNIVPPHTGQTGGMTASIEYAVAVLNVPHIIVCGHTGCGAMTGAMDLEKVKSLRHVSEWLTYSEAAVAIVKENYPEAKPEEKLNLVIEQNVLLQIRHLETHPHVAARLASRKIQLHGWVYNIGTGEVTAYDAAAGKFLPLPETAAARESAAGVI